MRRATPSNFDAIAELARVADVVGRDVFDALHQHVLEVGRRTESETGKDRELVRGVAAADIERRIGLRITELLRFPQNLAKERSVFSMLVRM